MLNYDWLSKIYSVITYIPKYFYNLLQNKRG